MDFAEGSSVFFSASKIPLLPNRGESSKSALSPKNELLSKKSAVNKDCDDTTLGASECRTLGCETLVDGFLRLTTTSSISSSDSMVPKGDKNAGSDTISSCDSMCSKPPSLRGSLKLREREGTLDMATGVPFFLRWVSIVVMTRARLMRDRLAMNFGSLLKRSVWMTYVILVMGGLDGSGWMIHPAMKMSARTLPGTGGILSDSTEHAAK